MYILECSDGSYYTGSTWNLERRLNEHQSGVGANHTSKRLPVRLVYFEHFDRVDEAYFREKQIQGWTHEKKKMLIEHNLTKIHELSKCKNETSSDNAAFGSAQAAVIGTGQVK